VRDEVHKVVEELGVVVPTTAAMEMGTSYAHRGSGFSLTQILYKYESCAPSTISRSVGYAVV